MSSYYIIVYIFQYGKVSTLLEKSNSQQRYEITTVYKSALWGPPIVLYNEFTGRFHRG